MIVEKLQIPGVKFLLIGLILSIVIGVLVLAVGLWPLFIPCFIVAFSFPSLMWVSYVYSKDKYEPEPARMVLIALTWGMLSTIPSMIFEIPFLFYGAFVTATIGAPLVEEFFKPMILPFLRIEIDNELDGVIYGVTAGMGFALMENIFYEINAIFFIGDMPTIAATWGILALARGLGSTVGHAVGAGVIGFAFGRYFKTGKGIPGILMAFGLAVVLHMTWNGLLSVFDMLAPDSPGIFIFMIVWPIFEFFILKAFLDKAIEMDEAMFGPGTKFDMDTKGVIIKGKEARPTVTTPGGPKPMDMPDQRPVIEPTRPRVGPEPGPKKERRPVLKKGGSSIEQRYGFDLDDELIR